MARWNLWLTFAWLVVGGILTWLWRDLVAWTNFMSLYACVGFHFSTYAAARAERKVEAAQGEPPCS